MLRSNLVWTGVPYLEVSLPDAESVFLLLLAAAPQAVADAPDDDHHRQSPQSG